MKVAKFGGTSLASAEQIKKVCNIILSDKDRRIMVVSAPGKRNKEDIKVTDLLINLADTYFEKKEADKELELVVARFRDIAEGLNLNDSIVQVIREDLLGRLALCNSNKDKFLDLMKAAGEDNSAKVVAEYLRSLGHEAVYMNPGEAGLILSDEFGNARVMAESFDALKKLNEINAIIVFPGFFGYSKSGDVVTFSRGGSDITGSILAAAVGAEMYENFTDVDSVFVANPNIVDNPVGISEITYREMRELSYAGFSVLHEETLEPVYRKGIPVCIKNTNNPSGKGTFIVTEREQNGRPVVGIAGDRGFSSIYIRKYMMNREIGFGRKVLSILEEEKIPYEHIPSGIDEMSVIFRSKLLSKEKEEKILNKIKDELNVDHIEIARNQALVMVVGEGMKKTVGLAVRATGALSRNGINIQMINQGSSEVSLMFGIDADNTERAVRALYYEFFGV
jgi:aspartate kinase